ncbi:PIG-L family deacetylase [Streptomyces fildesensis]|uniref:PIG-L family deacetylase n=1 Tax=Streptomyces fildesensis TaxID=375757 RepID=A0ABW8CHN8_9ACTN
MAGGVVWSRTGHRDQEPVPGPVDESAAFPDAGKLSFVQVIAHPDDDLYFINPGVQRAIARGSKVTTVLITAGEGDGINVDTDDKKRTDTPVDYAAYSGARHNGHRAAYARMATGSAEAAWRSQAVTLAGGLQAEHSTLVDRPSVSLYFLNLRKRLETPDHPYGGVAELWSGAMDRQETLPVPGSPVGRAQTVSRDQVVEALVDLFGKHVPTVVRTLDPDPEHDAGKSGYVVSDHRDHTATAQFTLRAVATYRDRTGASPAVDHYRGYANRFWPRNQGPGDVAAKAEFIRTYAGADDRACPADDCGDHQLGSDPLRSTHIFSTKLRYEPATDWLVRGADGRLALYVVLAGRVVGWQERTPGRDLWTGPTVIDDGRDGGWMLPCLSATAGRDGRVHLVGLRRTEAGAGGARLDVVHAVREAGAAAFGRWQSLGGPDSGEREQREVGVPAATVDGEGRLHVFVRDYAQGLRTRVERTPGGWDEWEKLGGTLLQDGPTAITTQDGRVEVFVPDKSGVRRWRQEQPGGALTAGEALQTGAVASGRVTVAESGVGDVVVVYRQANTAAVHALRLPAPGGGRPESPVDLGGGDGVGPVAVLWPAGDAVADVVTVRAGVDLAAHGPAAGRGPSAQWPALAGLTVLRGASLALGSDGTPVVAVLGADGRPRVSRFTTDAGADGAGFGPWKSL